MSDDTMAGVLVLAASGLFLLVMIFSIMVETTDDIMRAIDDAEDYVEYETPELIEQIWGVEEAIGKCSTCGLDDQPVYNNKCQWCGELRCLDYHLRTKGVRRYRSRAA